jgi:hypothetical protein
MNECEVLIGKLDGENHLVNLIMDGRKYGNGSLIHLFPSIML